ncbi:MAG: HAMP domain-containing sensor histidine kinase [Phycisphaerae bacterium]
MSPQTHTDGAAVATDGALNDVLRDYLHATEKLQSTHETLQREVIRLREELASKDRELERRRRLAALGELAAGVAHEVRNPLGAMQLYSGLLRNQCANLEGAATLIDKLEAGIQAIESVVQDTLSLTPHGCKFSPCAIAGLIEQVRNVCSPALARRRVALSIDAIDPRLSIQADPHALQRVLVNLIVNAAEASPAGSEVRLTVTADKEMVRLAVCDDGAGLPDEILDRIFDPFFTTKAQGTGLGLPIAFRLVEAHEGRLTARNRPEGGAEFVVTLPFQPRAVQADAA